MRIMTTQPAHFPADEADVTYYTPEPGSAWSQVEESKALLAASSPGATRADWQEQQRLHWSFQHMRELMPSQVIHGNDVPRPLPETPCRRGSSSLG